MTFTLIYWVLMLIWLVLGLRAARAFATSGDLLLFILLLILGWKIFGTPVHG